MVINLLSSQLFNSRLRKLQIKLFRYVGILLVFVTAGGSTSASLEMVGTGSADRFADLSGTKVHYKTFGKGLKAIIFIHGWACDASFWRNNVSAFGDYHVIDLDLPGHGESGKPHTNYSMDYFADAIESVMRAEHADSSVLVGHSMGAAVALRFYRRFPSQTLGLILVDAPFRTQMKESMETFAHLLRADYARNSKALVEMIVEPVRDVKLRGEIQSAMLRAPKYVSLSELDSLMNQEDFDLGRIDVPTLAIVSAWANLPPQTEEYYRRVIYDLDFQIWSNVSHFLMMERPGEFNRTVKKFLSERHMR